MIVFLCEDSPEGIFSGVSQAWESGLNGRQLRLELEKGYNYDLFSEYREVRCDFARAERAADRMGIETFILYDEGRKKAGVHIPGKGWYMVQGAEAAGLADMAEKTDQGEYAVLWKTFFEAVAVPERRNPACQKRHLPLRFRPFMTEFQSKN